MRLRIAAIWIVCQLFFFAGWAFWEEAHLADGYGQSILVKVAPVDPRDLLRGQYFRLAYDFSSPSGALDAASALPVGSDVWVVLKQVGRYYVAKSAQAQRPGSLAEGEVALKGSLASRWQILFGIERYFVPEGTPEPARNDLSVRLRIDSQGKPRIEQVYLRGTPWP